MLHQAHGCVCAVWCAECTLHTTQHTHTHTRLKCKLSDDGRRPKHVAALLICFNVNCSDL